MSREVIVQRIEKSDLIDAKKELMIEIVQNKKEDDFDKKIVGCLAFVFSFINVRTKYRTLRRYNLVRDFIYLDGLSLLLCILFKMFFPVQVDFSLIILLVDYYLCKKRFKEKAFKMLEAN